MRTTIIVPESYERFVIINDFHGGNGRSDDKECHNLHRWK